jgi:hypothetical protein
MKSKKYKFRFLLIASFIVLTHILLLCSGIFHVPLKNFFLTDGFLVILFFLSTLIISPGLDKEADNFVNRFLILTTLQMFAMMITVLILSVLKMDYFKVIGYHLLVVFVCLLVSQAIILVRLIKNAN